MSSPTLAEIQTQISNIVKLCDEARKWAGVNTPNHIGLEDTIIQALETDYSADVMTGLASMRAGLDASIRAGAAALAPLILEYGKYIKAPENDIGSILKRIYVYNHDNTQKITSRQFTYATPTAGLSNVGNGTINRLTTDDYGYAIENCSADAKVVKCVADANSGATKHEEVFEFRGATASKDELIRTGSGKVAQVKCMSARTSSDYTDNPSFAQYSGAIGAVTDLYGWTVTTIAKLDIDATNYYRDYAGESPAPASVKFTDNNKIVQAFSRRNVAIDRGRPYYAQIAYNRQIGSCDGTLKLTVGNVNATVSLVAQTGWNILRIAIGANSWYKTFDKQDPTFEIELSSRTGGQLLIDDFVFGPFENFDGLWYAPVGGSTPFLVDDVFTWTDSEVGSKIQHFLWKYFGMYWPHSTGGGITWADPA
jgi:hypothetical protein